MSQICTLCQSPFEISESDIAFLAQLSPQFGETTYTIPPPDHCPQCRLMHRYLWRAELHVFSRKSDLSGESILSQYPRNCPYKVYSEKEWWSDDWDTLSYGRDYDFSRPFFDQFKDLLQEVPLMGRSVLGNENCDYINCASWNKNCYLLAGANHNEDCYYGNFVNNCTDCIDNSFIDHCELCYECIDCTKCYGCTHCQNSSNCTESYFLFSCRGCKHCFGSVNLFEKEYVWMNEQLSKEEYEARLSNAKLDQHGRLAEAEKFFESHRLTYPHKHLTGEMNENVTGNAIIRSRNCTECFDISDCEDCKYCGWFHKAKNCMDCYAWGFPAEECYYCPEVGDGSYRCCFTVSCYNGNNIWYSYYTLAGCKNCFGCVSLRSNEYCILNKQYTKEEYEEILPRIIQHMQSTGEWGQFFPLSMSPHAYNQSIVSDYMPKSREDVEQLGGWWNDETTDAALQIIQKEEAFLKRRGLPLPSKPFTQRHNARLAKRNPRQLWDRTCAKCQKSIQTSYSPERPEIVYCESCYLSEVY